MASQREELAGDNGTEFGLVANGSAGSWDVDIDESLNGEQHWFLQINGPALYLNFQVEHPAIIDALIRFLDQPASGRGSQGQNGVSTADELEISRKATNHVAIVRDRNASGACIVSITGPAEFSAQFLIERNDLEDLKRAFHQVRDELLKRGLIPRRFCEPSADRN